MQKFRETYSRYTTTLIVKSIHLKENEVTPNKVMNEFLKNKNYKIVLLPSIVALNYLDEGKLKLLSPFMYNSIKFTEK